MASFVILACVVASLHVVQSQDAIITARSECEDGTCEADSAAGLMQKSFQEDSTDVQFGDQDGYDVESPPETESADDSDYNQTETDESETETAFIDTDLIGDSDPYTEYRALVKLAEQGQSNGSSLDFFKGLDTVSMNSSEALSIPDFVNYLEANLQAIKETIPGPYAVFAGDSTGILMKTHTAGYDLDKADEVASASKWHTGITILALVEDGLIDFHAPVSKYLKFWTTDANDKRSKVLVKHLLQFTSNFGGNTKRFWHDCIGEPAYTFKACSEHLYKTTYMGGTPGTHFFYDHTHTDMLAAIAEEVTGKPWLEIYKEKVADKIGFTIKADGTNGWGYSHSDISKKLHISANDYAKFLTALFKTVNGKGPLLKKMDTVKLFQEVGVGLCKDTDNNPVSNGVFCGGWFGDKLTYATTHFLGIDSDKWIYDASPGHWGFWPEMMLPNHQKPGKTLPKMDEFGGFWWQLAIQLPEGRDLFVKTHYYNIGAAVRKFLIGFFTEYSKKGKKHWGVATGILPQHDCSFPKFCACKISETYPHHPAEKITCDAGIRDSCKSGGLKNPVCNVASSQKELYSSPSLKRGWLKKGITYGCSLGACPWYDQQTATAGCPWYIAKAPEKCLTRTQKAGVRCCAPEGQNWIAKGHYYGRNKPRPHGYGCHGTKTYVEAVTMCASHGLRLCKKSELSRTCHKTNCNWLDKQPVWVSDSCAAR